MQHGLTPQLRKCLDFISSYIRTRRCAPSFEEIGASMGLESKSGVHRMIGELVERGHITRLPNRNRSIALTQPDEVIVDDATRARLKEHFVKTGELPRDVIADAVTIHLDYAESDRAEEAVKQGTQR